MKYLLLIFQAWISYDREMIHLASVLGDVSLTRKKRRKIDQLARRLLVRHIIDGYTLESIEAMLEVK